MENRKFCECHHCPTIISPTSIPKQSSGSDKSPPKITPLNPLSPTKSVQLKTMLGVSESMLAISSSDSDESPPLLNISTVNTTAQRISGYKPKTDKQIHGAKKQIYHPADTNFPQSSVEIENTSIACIEEISTARDENHQDLMKMLANYIAELRGYQVQQTQKPFQTP